MIAHSYLNTSVSVIQQYRGDQPLAHWLKSFFAADKKFGSRDRKQISHLVYCYYRLKDLTAGMELHEAVVLAVFLCSDQPQLVLKQLQPHWNDHVAASLEEKLLLCGAEWDSKKVFPWYDHLGEEIQIEDYGRSILIQPDLFIRVRPGSYSRVIKRLEEASIPFTEEEGHALRLANGTKVEEVIRVNSDIVIQDLNSQQVFAGFAPLVSEEPFRAWDACAASGGKTILFHDLFRNARISSSDIRASIVVNLKRRLNEAGMRADDVFIADLTKPDEAVPMDMDVIICDAPCTGSGTWARTPEQNFFFREEKIASYAGVQKSILKKLATAVKRGGFLIYITCSVFKEENEMQVHEFLQTGGFSLKDSRYLKGYQQKADTLFCAVLKKL